MPTPDEYSQARYNWFQWQKRAMDMQDRLHKVRRTLKLIDNPQRMAFLTPAVLVHMLEDALDVPDPALEERPDTRVLRDVQSSFDVFLETRQRLYQPGPLMGPLRDVQDALESTGDKP